ncbi:unnamed protein product, partial [Didymodactylos carnosus]
QAWGDQAPSDRTILNWYHEFQSSYFSVEDAVRSGRPRTAVNEETIDAVTAIIEDDPHSTYEPIEDTLGITSPSINSVIHDYLKLHKVCARWVPHQLTDDQKQFRIQFCRDSLERFEGGSIPLERGGAVTARWYINSCLPQVFETVSEWRQKTGLRGLILRDNNARPHRTGIVSEFLAENRVEPYPNSPYSPDLSPCDFFLFSKHKNQLRGIQFNDDNAMLNELEQAIDSLTKDDFKNCFDDWFIRMHKCIDADGQYFEKLHYNQSWNTKGLAKKPF